MMIRHFQRHHRAFSPAYSMPSGPDDRREPKVLVGDPDLFAAMVRRWNPFTQGHVAGVLSLAEEVSDEAAIKLAGEFFSILLPGMRDNSQYLALAIRHNERAKGGGVRTAVHWFVHLSDLWRNRKLNVLWPARDARRLECWQEVVNLREDWVSPKELSRTRTIRIRAWPECAEGAELASQYVRTLGKFPLGEKHCREEVACALMMRGAREIQLDKTPGGRFRARFAAESSVGAPLRFSAVTADEGGLDPLRRSSLRRVLGPTGFARTGQVFSILKTELIRQIEFAERRLQEAHEVCPVKLAATLTAVESCQFAHPQLVEALDETRMGFPTFKLPSFFFPADMTEPVAMEPLFA